MSTGDEREAYRLVDATGQPVEPVSVFLRELQAMGRSAATQRSYAIDLLRWWRFLDAVGQKEVALVAGHSFGGGVATAFTYEQPWRVSALLLANAIGSPTWALFPNEVRTMVRLG